VDMDNSIVMDNMSSVEMENIEFGESEEPTLPIIRDNSSYLRFVNLGGADVITKWEDTDEKIILIYSEKSTRYSYLYGQAYLQFERYTKFIFWPLVCLSFFSLFLQIIFAIVINLKISPASNGIFSIITTLISFCVAILSYLHFNSLFEKSAKSCYQAYLDFSRFTQDLKILLEIPAVKRAPPYQIITSIQNDFKKIENTYAAFELPAYLFRGLLIKLKEEANV